MKQQLFAIRWLPFVPILLLLGCVETAVVQKPAPLPPAPVFYPALPNSPRIQFLASFSSARDVAAPAGTFGRFILGDESSDSQDLQKPYGAALFEGKIYAVDTRGAGYVIFDIGNSKFDTVHGSGASAMPKPINITIDTDGTKYVTDTTRDQILQFDKDDNFVRAFGVKEQFEPADVAITDDKLYVADILHHNIQVLDKASGEFLSSFGKVGSAEGAFYYPTNLAIGPNGDVFVSDTGNFRVQEHTADGKFVKSFGHVGTGIGSFARPKGVSVDRQGRLYVVDAAFENVQVLDSEGRALLFFGEPGSNERAGLNLPTDISINYESVSYFQKYADPKFKLEYIILVASQFGRNKINVFGFGQMEGMHYPEQE